MWFAQYIVPCIEIILIATALNYLLSFFWNTRAMDLVLGLVAFLALFVLSSVLRFPVLQKLMFNVVNVAMLAILIIFQPELRIALSKLSMKGRRDREVSDFDRFLESISFSIYRLSERRIGALVVLENQDALEEWAQGGVALNADFSSELLESLFMTTTPLHDGSVIIRAETLVAAGVILPLADDASQLTRSMGTRHRAALGASQQSDSLAIVVSEETGRVSVARGGIMTRGVKPDRFKGILRSVFAHPQPTKKKPFNLLAWLRE